MAFISNAHEKIQDTTKTGGHFADARAQMRDHRTSETCQRHYGKKINHCSKIS